MKQEAGGRRYQQRWAFTELRGALGAPQGPKLARAGMERLKRPEYMLGLPPSKG
ncbi:MAG: hypothetical protein WAP11_02965 [Acetomicrobium sp.]